MQSWQEAGIPFSMWRRLAADAASLPWACLLRGLRLGSTRGGYHGDVMRRSQWQGTKGVSTRVIRPLSEHTSEEGLNQ